MEMHQNQATPIELDTIYIYTFMLQLELCVSQSIDCKRIDTIIGPLIAGK